MSSGRAGSPLTSAQSSARQLGEEPEQVLREQLRLPVVLRTVVRQTEQGGAFDSRQRPLQAVKRKAQERRALGTTEEENTRLQFLVVIERVAHLLHDLHVVAERRRQHANRNVLGGAVASQTHH